MTKDQLINAELLLLTNPLLLKVDSCGIRYNRHRTTKSRQLTLVCDGYDDDDGKNDISPDAWGMAKTSSLPSSSSQALLYSEHGLCVATGHPFAVADTAASIQGVPRTPFVLEEKGICKNTDDPLHFFQICYRLSLYVFSIYGGAKYLTGIF